MDKTHKLAGVAVLAAAALCGGLARAAETNLWSFTGAVSSLNALAAYQGALFGTTYNGGSAHMGTVEMFTPPAKAGQLWTRTVLYEFRADPDAYPTGISLTFDTNGNLYGTTVDAGGGGCQFQGGCGTVYELSPPATPGGPWTHTVLYRLAGGAGGFNPTPVTWYQGALYGMSSDGGIGLPGAGIVFQLAAPSSPGGAWTFTLLYSFGTNANDPDQPWAAPVFDSHGVLYGSTTYGGAGDAGAVFALAPPAAPGGQWTETVLYSFMGGTDGSNAHGGVAFGPDGALYGITTTGGTKFLGDVYRLAPPAVAGGAWTESILYTFSASSEGRYPDAGVVFDKNGALYSITQSGGKLCKVLNGCGTVFQLTHPHVSGGAWTRQTVYEFSGNAEGFSPVGVLFDSNGILTGSTANVGQNGAVFQLKQGATGKWTAHVTYNYQVGADGGTPTGNLVADRTGALYGTTTSGGSGSCYSGGCGTVVKLTPPATPGNPWTEKVLYDFAGGSVSGGTDGANPEAGLIFDQNGALYGTTYKGGKTGNGTVFRLTPPKKSGGPWKETILYSFKGGSDGRYPDSTLIFDSNGALYGTTHSGGGPSSACGSSGCGTVFQLTPPAAGGAWTEQVLYAFQGNNDGQDPVALALQNGTLYGVTYGRVNSYGVSLNNGTVFQLAPPAVAGGAWTETVLHYFSGENDGTNPWALILDNNGAIYGVTVQGVSGCGRGGCGTVFQLTPPAVTGGPWTKGVLYAFPGGAGGAYPYSLIWNGNTLEGTTLGGGTSGSGTLFQLTPPASSGGAWSHATLFDFASSNGSGPQSIILNNGALFGVASAGGALGEGTAFEFQ